ncbi:MAG TPA: gamma-glutamyltransferase [Gammaproteobacteria bacterium]|nr:gamma-glutamyltransferase [Gammaproteobacteria bacterium]|tara:strand:- start:3212 stop:4957 length:1746 start_codon:yes stop_codon:yes gene_type:complete
MQFAILSSQRRGFYRAAIFSCLTLALTLSSVQVRAVAPAALYGEKGAVASRSVPASQAGADILAAGGTAVDAAVAVGFALAVTYPSAGNLGGGGFMVIHLADGRVVTNDHRERAPLKATRDMFLDANGDLVKGLSTASHLAVGVPGSVQGLLDVLEKYGTLPRAKVLQPAIDLAEKGFILDRDLAGQFARRQTDFAPYPASTAIFSKDGEPYQAGDLFVQKDLAETLKRIQKQGRDGFYAGKTADLLVAEMEQNGGLISHQDLQGYRSVWREPIRGTYRGHEIFSMPPPSSGGILLVQMLNMMEPYDLKKMGFGSADTIHTMIEAERRAYADRAEHLGDSDFFPVPIDELISKAYAKQRFADFDPKQASRSEDIGAGEIAAESLETTHASVMDAAGNAVAYTTTLNLSYGAKMVAAGTGVLLNNEMDDFSAKENSPNFFGLIGRAANSIEPGKRMLSSMTPTIVRKNGKPLLVTGSPGGSTIITTTLQVVLNVIDHDMDVSDAVASPRFHHQWLPERVIYERFALSPDTRARLEAMGHDQLQQIPTYYGRGIGDANTIMSTEEGIFAMPDPRNRGGAAAPE